MQTFKKIALGISRVLTTNNYQMSCTVQKGDESIMSQKAHGTSAYPVMKELKFGVDWDTADKICNFNRHYAEHSGYAEKVNWTKYLNQNGTTKFFDSVTGILLFEAPKGRTLQEFIEESNNHGWPSFRQEEIYWDNVRQLEDGEMVSLQGTHLGHNLPDNKGNRFCINLVSVAGQEKKNNE